MNTITLDDKDAVSKTVDVLRHGGVVIVPTDTVYGIGCGYEHSNSLKKIIIEKGRDPQNPIALLASSILMVEDYVHVTPKIRGCLLELWPGPFTAVFHPKKGTETIGMRVPNHAFARAIIDGYNRPLWMTSANKSGSPAYTRIAAVLRDFKDAKGISLVVDAGDLPDNIASTVVDFTKTPPAILRAGPISRERLEEIFKEKFQ